MGRSWNLSSRADLLALILCVAASIGVMAMADEPKKQGAQWLYGVLIYPTEEARKVYDGMRARHDRIVAFLSHAPQVASWALLEAARGDPVARRHLSGAGPGFRDMTRLARSPEALWREILKENRAEVARALVAVARRLAARAPGAVGSRRTRRPRGRSDRTQ